jgi:chloramphenicol 3-O phosphotransferase
MIPQVIMLNGGSSSGKSSIARALQAALADPWLALSVDTFVDALPPGLLGGDGIDIADNGEVTVGAAFTELDAAWSKGIAAMVRAGARIVLDDVFLGGPTSQQRWREALTGLSVLWVGVRCASDVASAREAARGDRTTGMAAIQAELVHRGIEYDLEVDSADATPEEIAQTIIRHAGLRM